MLSVKTEYLILLSFILSIIVITHAFYVKKQFYPSIVYLTKSSSTLAVLYIQALMLIILLGKIIQKLFFGTLRAIEIEHLYDRLWFSITETCLAFTVFRDDFSPSFVGVFTMLIFLKVFHWLLEDRVDYMEQSPVLGIIFHLRVTILSTLLLLSDYYFTFGAYNHTVVRGASSQIVFGFEYAILFVSVLAILMKYILHSIEINNGEQWENKGVVMLYSDLISNFIRVVLYMSFMLVMMRIHTFPLFSIRPMFITMKAFRKSCADVVESRRAIQNLNTMYPDLTAEELENVRDNTCIICREDMQAQQSIKRLPCLHIFHKNCLRSWFQRQQTCPICRDTVVRDNNVPFSPRSTNQETQNSTAEGESNASSGSSPTVSDFRSFTFASSQALNLNNLPFTTFASFPMVLPPYAFPPPPLPPLNFTNLSEEAIRQMERFEIVHVQARLESMRNIRSLLDGSLSQMEEYMNTVVRRTDQSSDVNQ